ncbi:hypothetical protein K788_00041305 [Paraburkholderia caribensis MBA4]|uniref:Uncharacterized protein n=1 Tax=Paraburkholderia caribensis MBA4 TaxID=1323664 RepID=A0A0P0REP1_9BURK|nr:hypothetical protein [Paraburkholderia caribensis]ALL67076.1 hypothetical protein K788_00041305 [Paraburkholderia caribensis MBA4]
MSQHRHGSDDPQAGKRPSPLEPRSDSNADSNATPKAAPADDRYPRFSTADIEKMMRFGMI